MRKKRQTILDFIYAQVDARIAELQRQKALLVEEQKAFEQQRVARRAGAAPKPKRSDVSALKVTA